MEQNTPMVTGEEKRKVYVELKTKLKIALSKEFFYEAVMIEYAIIEDRTASILHHAGICANAYDENRKLGNKLNSIEQQHGKGHPIISKKVDMAVIESIRAWKDKRNRVVHRACFSPYTSEEIRQIAEEGNEIVKLITNCARRVSDATKKLSQIT